ncbi:bis(5'-nucleosyl)-tetraphosphatase [Mycoplasma miroungirhinis]|uniref:Bis(5'-nucleosyl)-tetraphosphatase [asymmetrical] n=1 Tax=Mycoplasma miroungirhinis TaxID=754516 RepID=A0A6M4JDN9_9MOLU|nr:NUDIX domain-containing protein [Mycoplasma miroungirhinis]QJR44358.1 NUDIX domain-containing protein [Mycoplasma miroungirhinis]
MKKEKSCGLILFDLQKDKTLVLVIDQKTHWGFPKGHVENNETEEQTAIREVWEETGIDAIPFATDQIRLVSNYIIYDNTPKEVVYFIGIPTHKNITKQEEEINDAKWVKTTEAYNILSYNEDKEHLTQCLKFLNKLKPFDVWKKYLK